jgi:hypothetical protein
LKTCQATVRALQSFRETLDGKQKEALACQAVAIRNAAAALGAEFIDVRLDLRR